ncbi:MAG: GDYXXLXY domain-containing protein [Candidatus Omnitrophica bacterium]|nr:GDYXXLXY domain-containing protein [Candidatus Omnitrophota bacterium]
MSKRLIIPLFFCVAILQVVTPLSMIVKREKVLSTGKQFKFKTAPVDPFDAFRGRYVALRIDRDHLPLPKDVQLEYGQKIYALIKKDVQGFAGFSSVTTERPRGKDYLETKVKRISRNQLYLEMPFDRYYMEEKAAPAAEKAYREHSRNKSKDAYVTVRIKSGFAVLEELYVGGKPISEFIKQNQ